MMCGDDCAPRHHLLNGYSMRMLVRKLPFLRLKKKPFRFQGEFDPLAASDLDVLQAYALLENRAGLLERITALAQPAKRRRDGLRCFAELRLRDHRRVGYLHKMTFEVPADSRQAELSPDSFGVVLTQDDPDVLLDPARWQDHTVRIEDVRLEGGASTISVSMAHTRFQTHFEPLLRLDPAALWYLDEIFYRPKYTKDDGLPAIHRRAGDSEVTVRKDVLSFLRDPLQFSEGVDEQSRKLWLSALEDFALPLSIDSGRRLGSVQEEAWRTLSSYRLGLILGPPGTGKTFALSWMAVSYLLARRKAGLPCRVLLTGFTINSIGNLLAGTEEKVRSHQLTGFRSIFCGTSAEEAFPDGVETFKIGDSEDRDSVWERLREPYVIAGLTTWSLYRLLSESDGDGRDGPTLPLFDLVCIDEASQMMVAQGLMALAGLRPDGRVLVAGDNQQLPPVQAMFDREINGRQLGSSLYEFLKTAQAPEVRFEETRRMNRPLAAFGSREFYEDRFYPAADIADQQLQLSATWKAKSQSLGDVLS